MRKLGIIQEAKDRGDRFYFTGKPCKICVECSSIRTNAIHKEGMRLDPDYRRRRSYPLRYGITYEEYQEMLTEQNNQCLGCRNSFSDVVPCVDHCHASKKVRGILCSSCNKALGHVRDSVETLENLKKYLQKISL